MNKKLLSLAVAAAVAAPAAVLADATFYGKAHVSLDYFDLRTNNTGFQGWTMSRGQRGKGNPRANRVGVKGSEDLGGLKGIYQVEFGVPLANEDDYDFDDGDRASGVKMRNSYVGLQSDFGTILAGRHDTPFKLSTQRLELFNDTMADYEGTIGFDDVRADNTVAYMSPNWGGFRFAGAIVPGAASTTGGSNNDKSDNLTEGWSLAALYSNGPWHASAAYELLGEELGACSSATTDTCTTDTTTGLTSINTATTANDFKKWRVGLGMVDFQGFTLTGLYERWKGANFGESKNNKAKLWQVQAGYTFGNTMLKAMYGKQSFDKPKTTGATRQAGGKSWAVGLDHNFTKRTKAYLLYTRKNGDKSWADDRTGPLTRNDDDWKGFSLGMIHDF